MSAGLKVIALLCALVVTSAVFAGYAYLRKRHAQQTIASVPQETGPPVTPKGPPKVHIVIDEALIKTGQTIIGGSVKNISGEKLAGLSVELELRRRRDGSAEQRSVPLEPAQLEPEQEGRYSLTLLAQDYGSVRLIGLRGGQDSRLLAYTSSQGQRRPPERLEPKLITVPKPRTRSGEFLNSPENPARVP